MTTKSTNDRTLSPSVPLVDHTYVQRMGCPALVFLVSTQFYGTSLPTLPFSLFESVLTIGRAPRSSSWLYIYMPNITPKQRKGSFDHPYYPINIVNKASTTTAASTNNNNDNITTNLTNNNINNMSSPNQVPKSGATTFGDRKGSGTLFSGIEHYKRQDGPAAKQRRDSLKDMQPKPGFIANLWNK